MGRLSLSVGFLSPSAVRIGRVPFLDVPWLEVDFTNLTVWLPTSSAARIRVAFVCRERDVPQFCDVRFTLVTSAAKDFRGEGFSGIFRLGRISRSSSWVSSMSTSSSRFATTFVDLVLALRLRLSTRHCVNAVMVCCVDVVVLRTCDVCAFRLLV